MARLTKADAARQLGISRTTLYKLIEQGKVSATADGLIDQAELVRVAPSMDAHRERHSTLLYATRLDTSMPVDEHIERPVDSASEQREQASTGRQLTSTLQDVVHILREQLQAAQEREALLLRMLHESHQRYDRLLEAPRASMPAPTGEDLAPETPRGQMRRRIVALLHDHPAGLSPAQIRRHLGATKDLGPTIHAMARDGLLVRVEAGRYVVPLEG